MSERTDQALDSSSVSKKTLSPMYLWNFREYEMSGNEQDT